MTWRQRALFWTVISLSWTFIGFMVSVDRGDVFTAIASGVVLVCTTVFLLAEVKER